MPLSDTTCRAAKPAAKLKKLSDSGGLQLWVFPNGSRLWRLAYRFGRKQKLLSLGRYPEVGLGEARDARDAARKQLRGNIDPSQAKQAARQNQGMGTTFQHVVKEYLAKLEREQRADATKKKAEWVLSLVEARLAGRILHDITSADVLDALRPIEARGRYDTARRAKSTVGAVFRYAIANGRATVDPTQALKGALTRPNVTPRAAVTEARALAKLLRAIDGYRGQPTTAAALRLLPLVFTRPGELRAAAWSEFDLQAAVWTIPATRTKMRRPHKVPLSPQALDIICGLKSQRVGGSLLFPSIRTLIKPISENTLNAALRALDYDKHTVTAHGFRATASTLLNESGKWGADAIERQLGHVEGNAVRRAYARSEHWAERVKMMNWWADYLDTLKTGAQVIQFVR